MLRNVNLIKPNAWERDARHCRASRSQALGLIKFIFFSSLAVSGLLIACQSPPYLAQTPTHPSSLPALSTMASSSPLLATDTSRVHYAIGNPHFRGRTTVMVAGTGAVTVEFQRGDQVDRYSDTLSASELTELKQVLAANDPRQIEPSQRPGEPDEERIELTIHHDATGEQLLVWWSNEQWNHPALRALVVTFTDLAKHVSGGRVQY